MALRAVLRSPLLAKTQWHGVQPIARTNIIKQTGQVMVKRQGGAPTFPQRGSFDPHNTSRRLWEDITFWSAVHTSAVFGIILAVNIIQGKPRLADIPEGYVPEHWEYYESPITRLQAKYFTPDPAMIYEISMESHFRDTEKRKIRLLSKKMQRLNREFADYQTWWVTSGHTHADRLKVREDHCAEDISATPVSRLGLAEK